MRTRKRIRETCEEEEEEELNMSVGNTNRTVNIVTEPIHQITIISYYACVFVSLLNEQIEPYHCMHTMRE